MKINYNVSAVIANNYLNRSDNKLQESMGRLSSGLKIVKPKDNPSGLAMSKRMNAQIEGLDQAKQNSNDGISIVQIADGAMSEIHEMLQRVNELSVKASTGTLTDDDRVIINEEVKQLTAEIDRIASEVEFNGQKLLDGSFDLKGYSLDNADVNVAYYSDDMKSGEYDVSLDVAFDGDIIDDVSNLVLTGPDVPADAEVSHWDGNTVTIKGSQGFELRLEIGKDAVAAGATVAAKISLEGFGAMDTQIGSNEGQQLAIRMPKVSLENMGIAHIDVSTETGAKETIDKVDGAIKYISSVRSRLGAYENRLEHTVKNLDITSENVTEAYSRIMDTDMAEEMTEYTTLQVLSQASTSILAQANERPAQVLQLLQ